MSADQGNGEPEMDNGTFTLVISAVTASISRSSAVRSVKPGRACFACNLSRALTTCTGQGGRISHDKGERQKRDTLRRVVRTFELCIGDDGLYSVRNVHPGGTDVRDGLER